MYKKVWNEKGQVLILTVLMFSVLFVFVGLGIDVWKIVYNKNSMQDGLDLVALAAIQEVTKSNGNVTAISVVYATKNGIKPAELTINYPYSGDTKKIELIATRSVQLNFLQVLGINSKNVSVRSVAEVKKISYTSSGYKPFEYAVFSGSSSIEMAIKGSGSTINGNIHSNISIGISGSKHQINGNVTACSKLTTSTATITGVQNASAPYVPMPNIDFNQYAAVADQVFNSDLILNGEVTIDGVWLVNGNLHITGSRVSGKGIILATGGIQISGSLEYVTAPTMFMKIDGTTGYLTYGDQLALYSLAGIQISASNANISGTLYAPTGRISIAGSGNSFNGALIADNITWATNETTISGKYDLRVPQSFVIEEEVFVLAE